MNTFKLLPLSLAAMFLYGCGSCPELMNIACTEADGVEYNGELQDHIETPNAETIYWKVDNQFRLFEDENDFHRVYSRLKDVPTAAAKGKSKIHPSPIKGPDLLRCRELPKTKWDSSEHEYVSEYLPPEEWPITAWVKAEESDHCSWEIESTGQAIDGCIAKLTLPSTEETLIVNISRENGSILTLNQEVKIDHKVIVVLGDSYASGEGVPDVNQQIEQYMIPPVTHLNDTHWWDKKCHRSLPTSALYAAMEWISLPKKTKHRAVSFLSYACSGAEIGDLIIEGKMVSLNNPPIPEFGGILTPYSGRETKEQLKYHQKNPSWNCRDKCIQDVYKGDYIEPQLNQAIRDLCPGTITKTLPFWTCSEEIIQPDLLVLSVGGNDVGFGELITSALIPECERNCLGDVDRTIFNELKKKYAFMATTINQHLSPKNVIVLDYGDPTKDENGDYCKYDGSIFEGGVGIGPFRISEREYKKAYTKIVRPLNSTIKKVVREYKPYNWHWVGGMQEATKTKGICSKKSWFNTTYISYKKQNIIPRTVYLTSGVLHPNIIYHYNQKNFIVRWMLDNGF